MLQVSSTMHSCCVILSQIPRKWRWTGIAITVLIRNTSESIYPVAMHMRKLETLTNVCEQTSHLSLVSFLVQGGSGLTLGLACLPQHCMASLYLECLKDCDDFESDFKPALHLRFISCVYSWRKHLIAFLFYFFSPETRSHCIVQAGLELAI